MLIIFGIIVGGLLLAMVFGFLGIAIFSRIKNAKKYVNKKNLIIFCVIYGIALLFTDVAGPKSLGGSLGYLGYPWISAILTIGVKTKFKKIFSDQFYYAFLGTLIFSILSTLNQL